MSSVLAPAKATPHGFGTGRAVGHFGELVQGRLGPQGPVVLVTLPCPVLSARATCLPGALSLHFPGARLFTPAQLHRFARALDLPAGLRFTLQLDMPPGGGAGASTAALVAMARAAGIGEARRIARACLAAEGASDPVMFAAPERLLWASREGRVVAGLPPLPHFAVIGGFFGPTVRTDPRDSDFPDISDLVAAWPMAARTAAGLAGLATLSASRRLAHQGRTAGDPTAALARDLGALGWAMAHTGAARALLFRPGEVPAQAPAALRGAGFRTIVHFAIGGEA